MESYQQEEEPEINLNSQKYEAVILLLCALFLSRM